MRQGLEPGQVQGRSSKRVVEARLQLEIMFCGGSRDKDGGVRDGPAG